MEDALDYRATTDDEYADKKTDVLRLEILCKRVRARAFLTQDGSVESRKAASEGHQDVIKADEDYVKATVEFERLKASRETADILIDAFRTVEASRRKS
jgi:hypothetical protein